VVVDDGGARARELRCWRLLGHVGKVRAPTPP
jgi:hypothetical protein